MARQQVDTLLTAFMIQPFPHRGTPMRVAGVGHRVLAVLTGVAGGA